MNLTRRGVGVSGMCAVYCCGLTNARQPSCHSAVVFLLLLFLTYQRIGMFRILFLAAELLRQFCGSWVHWE